MGISSALDSCLALGGELLVGVVVVGLALVGGSVVADILLIPAGQT